ncbi:MAG: HAD family phosphatase [Candidatus Solibacter usitatus]|nr:HAD family phosphatase [Candidatus Solibacter usitatus]
MIKTVIFDLGGVIVPLDFPKGYAAMATHSPFPVEEIRERIIGTGLAPQLECGKISSNEFRERLCEVLRISVTADEFRNLWSSIFPSHTLIPEELLTRIRSKHRLLLLSNTNELHFEVIQRNYGHMKHFDHYVLSYVVGHMKPSPEIYAEAIAHAECGPAECFFTDDVAAYVEGARKAGIDAVQFKSYEQLLPELRRRGVDV